MSAVAFREIPLSDSPRQRPQPRFVSRYLGSFTGAAGGLVGLRARGTYDLAKDVFAQEAELVLERDHDNEHDLNAVAAYWETGSPQGRDFVGYVDADTARTLAPELGQGAQLRAKPLGRPYAGANPKGGTLPVKFYLADE